MRLIESIRTDAPAIAAMRRDIHAHPELCFEEQRTSAHHRAPPGDFASAPCRRTNRPHRVWDV